MAEEPRQETEGLLIADLEAVHVTAVGVRRQIELPPRQTRSRIRNRRAAGRERHAVRQSESVVGEGVGGPHDLHEAADVLLEQRQRQQRVLREIPLERQVVRLGAIRIEVRIAGIHGLVRAGDTDRCARSENAETGCLPAAVGSRHDLGCRCPDDERVGNVERHVQGRQRVAVLTLDGRLYRHTACERVTGRGLLVSRRSARRDWRAARDPSLRS